ncbi:hypothetical protein EGW08_002764 [Elysia chlorotica]|uniref:Uncharacterized protein n=1 Tax=Elysia chlorotica TaxID=188477 RepID=A0A3S1HZV7_ELYCH|nr:hypothetical protein EGW08_002764 [Elysia chlorotica]
MQTVESSSRAGLEMSRYPSALRDNLPSSEQDFALGTKHHECLDEPPDPVIQENETTAEATLHADQGEESSPTNADQAEESSPTNADQGEESSPPNADQGEEPKESSPPNADQGEESSPPNADQGEESSPPNADQGEESSPPNADQGEESSAHNADQREDSSPTNADQTEESSPTNADQTDQETEASRSSQGSSQPDVTEFEESNLSSEDGALEADVSSFESTVVAPSSGQCRTRARRCQTLKYCFMASARKSSGYAPIVPKFYSVYGSESGEDSTDDKVKETEENQAGSGREIGSRKFPLCSDRDTHSPTLPLHSTDYQCARQEESPSLKLSESPEASCVNKPNSIRVRKDRYSSFFGYSPAVSCPPSKYHRVPDSEIEPGILLEHPAVTGLPPRSQKKKPKAMPLRITCLEKATPFSPRKLSCLSPRSPGPVPGVGDHPMLFAEGDATLEVHNSSGSVQLDSVYYSDSSDSPSLAGGPRSPPLVVNKQWGDPDSLDSVARPVHQQDIGQSRRVWQGPQARRNLQHLFSTPKQAGTNTPGSDPDLYRVSPIDADPAGVSWRDADPGTFKVDIGQDDLMGISGLEVLPDSKPLPETDLTSSIATSRTDLTGTSQPPTALHRTTESAPRALAVSRNRSPEKAVRFVLPPLSAGYNYESRYRDSSTLQLLSGRDHTNSQSYLRKLMSILTNKLPRYLARDGR